jgi:tetratricopeptide (TPR) repeat protein
VAVLMILPLSCALAALVAAALDPGRRLWPVAALLGVVGFGAVTFYYAGSRSGLVGLVAALAVLVTLGAGRARRWLKMRAPLEAVPVVLLAAVVLGGALWMGLDPGRRARLIEKVRLSSIAARYYGPVAAAGILREHPVGGSGAGTFLSEAPKHIPRERYMGSYATSFLNVAHNEYAETAAELGVLGLAIFLTVLVSAAAGAYSRARNGPPGYATWLAAGLCATMVAVAVSSLGDPSFRYWDFTGVFYAAAALAASAGRAGEALTGTSPGEALSFARAARGGEPEPESEVEGAEAGEGDEADGEATGRLRLARMLVAAGAVIAVALNCVLWSFPDARREVAYLKAHQAAGAGNHALATGEYMLAARTPGYFLSRVLSHYDWVRERVRCGRHDDALRLAEDLALIMPECPQVLRYLAMARYNAKDRGGALRALVRAGRRDPFDRKFFGDYARVFLKQTRDQPEAAEKNAAMIAAAAGKLKLNASEIATLRSLCLAAAKDWSGAAGALSGVRADDVRFLLLEFWRGMALRKAGKADRAAAALNRHLERYPLHPQGHRELARARRAVAGVAGSDAEIASLRRCVELDVEHEEARLSLLRALMARKRYQQALEVVLPYLAIARAKPRFYMEAAEIQRLLGRKGEARRLLEQALRRTGHPDVRKMLENLDSGGGAESSP